MSTKRICLVTPGHLASNPRIVKEADALHDAGFQVKVIYCHTMSGVAPLDDTVRASALWSAKKLDQTNRALHRARRLRQEFARTAYARGLSSVRMAVSAHSAIAGALTKAAVTECADLYIAHCLAALPAVCCAASRYNAKMGFDAEDDHVGELESLPEHKLEIRIRKQIEARFLPQCQHLTASSPGIAHAYNERYGVEMIPVLNVFPLTQAPQTMSTPKSGDDDAALSIYWFSQTIGPGRGLEPVIIAMGKTQRRVRLSIRGSDFLGYSALLKALAAENGVADSICFLPSAPPAEMARLAAVHDVGLASELNTPPNRAICLSNKIFTYLLAGLPVLLSGTPAQRELARELGDAARLIDLDMPEQIANALDEWASDADALARARCKAAFAARNRFNWDVEKQKFLASVRGVLQEASSTKC